MMKDRVDRQIKAAQQFSLLFGEEKLNNDRIQVMRFIKEALRLVHSMNISRAKLNEMFETVYHQKRFSTKQQVGKVGLSLLTLGHSLGLNVDDLEEFELGKMIEKGRDASD